MARLKYLYRPLQQGLDLSVPSMHQGVGTMGWPIQNVAIDQRSIFKRSGYVEDRDLGANVDVQSIIFFVSSSGTTQTIFLTDTNAIKRESSYWSYITQRLDYTAKIDSISNITVTLKAGETPSTDGVAASDFFILDDDYTAASEPQSAWEEISSAADGGPTITLKSAYTGTVGTWTGSEKTGYVRRVYSVPDNERWTWAIVQDASNNDLLCFTNGDTHVQKYTGSGTATDLDATNATRARYCIEYANRLVLLDTYIDGSRRPFTLKYSKNGDPTNWTDSSAGEVDLIETEEIGMGLGKVGSNLVVYKTDSLVFGHTTGDPVAPIAFGREVRGIGTPAPYSIVHALGTNVFIGRNGFYIIEGDRAIEIPSSEKIRYKFFDLVNPAEIKRCVGHTNFLKNEVRWFATDTDNQRRCFVWNYKYNEWYHHIYAHNFSCGGKGEI